MKVGRFRIGLRTIKTALSVMICILLFKISGRGPAMIASLAAVFAMREDVPSTISFGKSRILGNLIGGCLALLYILIARSFQHNFYVELLIVPLFVALLIVISDGTNNNTGIMGASATLLIIVLSIPEKQTMLYALNRVLDTFIGTFVAIGVNRWIMPPKQSCISEAFDYKEAYQKQQKEIAELQEQLDKKANYKATSNKCT